MENKSKLEREEICEETLDSVSGGTRAQLKADFYFLYNADVIDDDDYDLWQAAIKRGDYDWMGRQMTALFDKYGMTYKYNAVLDNNYGDMSRMDALKQVIAIHEKHDR